LFDESKMTRGPALLYSIEAVILIRDSLM